ncbi:GNAT family N-acetyltransferase [Aestuariibacter sp. AA17]|uniref:GNAT family N-acetyltransferase n=1 Tax=Fluctibacter corallii TaxID=2984329 RepID=A0ABT3A9D1_9ALTE|nr:GNAT family N-acetyltransferase [Aestuariibacter sp. AA17]MCV2885281.1 GNAT family N-acetyltransferase [Aestuariibacter sp. AA17]
MVKVEEITSTELIASAFQIMQQLRPDLEKTHYVSAVVRQRERGYKLMGAYHGKTLVALMGFWVGEKLAWGKHVYIDDLIVDETYRSKNAGKVLLEWVTDYAKQHQCQQVHLDSGVQRFGAHKFYLREDFIIASHHFAKKLN